MNMASERLNVPRHEGRRLGRRQDARCKGATVTELSALEQQEAEHLVIKPQDNGITVVSPVYKRMPFSPSKCQITSLVHP